MHAGVCTSAKVRGCKSAEGVHGAAIVQMGVHLLQICYLMLLSAYP